MRDGIYKVQFQTQLGSGAGAVVPQGGKLRGGDSSIYYIGTYSQNGDQLTADVAIDRHSAGLGSVFGVDRAHINLTGKVTGDAAQMTGTAREAPNVTFQAILSRIGD